MNKYLLYTVLFIGLSFVSCTDKNAFFDEMGQKVPVSLTVSFTGDVPSRDVNDKDDNLDYTTDPQSAMSSDDTYVLIVSQADNKLLGLVQDLKLELVYNNYNEKRLLGNIPADFVGKEIRLVILTNLTQNQLDLGEEESSVKDFLESKIGETASSIYQSLVYSYQYEDAPWEILDKDGKQKRRIPMWGETGEFTLPVEGKNLSCLLYRAIAKVNIWINGKEGINSFKINSITVNHANNGGYVVSSKELSSDITVQYTTPDVPATVTPFSDTEKITYSNLTDEQATKAFSDVIFLPEHDNTSKEKTPVSLTVNYDFNGDKGLEKNIEFKDKSEAPFDVVRNHSYIFDIVKIHDDFIFEVKVEPWENVYMRGAPDQYTLTVDKSVITLKDYVDYKNSNNPNHHYIVYDLNVWTDYSYGWEIDTNEEGKIKGTNGEVIDWLDIENTNGNTNETVTVKLNANKINTGLEKIAKFYVKAGNIRKEITVIMPQPETANCYVVGDGEYEIIVTIKGNGVDGTRPEGWDIVDGDEKSSPEKDAMLQPVKLGIIWETKEGLIGLYDWESNAEKEEDKYVDGKKMDKPMVKYNPNTGTLGFSVKSNYTGAYIAGAPGGNALIGAFDGEDNLIWSWHIWVCPEMYDSNTHQIKENVFLQNWTYTGYQVMDRNLGALSNKPIETQTGNQKGVAAMGLQYQWGRKDPFIGPAYSNDDFDGKEDGGLLPVVHYYERWGVNGNGENVAEDVNNGSFNESSAIDYTIKHPTQLVYWEDNYGPTALISYPNYGDRLWGTNQGLNPNVKDLGTKTIYDPCPVGYRVPPVDAFWFEYKGYKGHRNEYTSYPVSGYTNWVEHNSYDHDFRHNLIYVPHHTLDGEEGIYTPNAHQYLYVISKNDNITQIPVTASTFVNWYNDYCQWGDYHTHTMCYKGYYIVNADYYGFYVNYNSMHEPKLANNTTAQAHYRLNGNESSTNVNYYYKLEEGESNVTWIPLTGAYDPELGVSFKDGDKTISIQQGSSITINSFLWTNSSVTYRDNTVGPGALILHGTEDTYTTKGNLYYGRHFHSLSDDDGLMRPGRHYTSAVRCIKDTHKVDWQTSNSLTNEVSIKKGGSGTIKIKAVNGAWKLVDPGEPWIQITPEKGEATGAQEATITVKVSDKADVSSSTNIGFKIEGENTLRYCTVTVIK